MGKTFVIILPMLSIIVFMNGCMIDYSKVMDYTIINCDCNIYKYEINNISIAIGGVYYINDRSNLYSFFKVEIENNNKDTLKITTDRIKLFSEHFNHRIYDVSKNVFIPPLIKTIIYINYKASLSDSSLNKNADSILNKEIYYLKLDGLKLPSKNISYESIKLKMDD